MILNSFIMQKILVVEDDEPIQNAIQDILISNDYLVETAPDGIAALEAIKKSSPDLLILDLGLPKMSGESVCITVRKQYPQIPVIILTAKNQSEDVVRGLTSLGADDYISKPFEIEELLARIRVRLRSTDEEEIHIGDLELHTKTFEVKRAGKTIQLSPHEFKLLHYLMSNKGRVLTREMILNRVWQYSYDVDSRVVDVYIGYLRKKIDEGFEQKMINSVRGFGYIIKE